MPFSQRAAPAGLESAAPAWEALPRGSRARWDPARRPQAAPSPPAGCRSLPLAPLRPGWISSALYVPNLDRVLVVDSSLEPAASRHRLGRGAGPADHGQREGAVATGAGKRARQQNRPQAASRSPTRSGFRSTLAAMVGVQRITACRGSGAAGEQISALSDVGGQQDGSSRLAGRPGAAALGCGCCRSCWPCRYPGEACRQ